MFWSDGQEVGGTLEEEDWRLASRVKLVRGFGTALDLAEDSKIRSSMVTMEGGWLLSVISYVLYWLINETGGSKKNT
jgi:hypothetical protein